MGPVAPLYTIFSFGIYIPTVAVTYRRFHDINKSGWNFLWMLTVIGCIPVLVWLCRKSEPQSNKYGADPLAQKAPNQSGITADASAAASAPAPAPVSTQGEVDFDKLEKLSQLHKSGVLSDEEFATQKAKVLGA